MGIDNNIKKRQFQIEDLRNRDLILKMLKYEDELYLGEYGQNCFRSKYNERLHPHYHIQRKVLNDFNFTTTDESLKLYREIYHTYPDDKEIHDSVVYLRENRCLKYTAPKININDIFPNTVVYGLDGKTEYDLYSIMKPYEKVVVGAFSTS